VWILDCRFEDGQDEKKHSLAIMSQALVILVIASEEALGLKWECAYGGAGPKGIAVIHPATHSGSQRDPMHKFEGGTYAHDGNNYNSSENDRLR